MDSSSRNSIYEVNQNTTIDEVGSPYHIHPFDNHITTLVQAELNGTNYLNWSKTFTIALSARNKLDFTNGRIKEPEARTSLHQAWSRCNDLVVSWLLRGMSSQIASTVFYVKHAYQIWELLKKLFALPDDNRVCKLQNNLCNITQRIKEVNSYYTKLVTIWKELRYYRPPPHCFCRNCDPECFQKFADLQDRDKVYKS